MFVRLLKDVPTSPEHGLFWGRVLQSWKHSPFGCYVVSDAHVPVHLVRHEYERTDPPDVSQTAQLTQESPRCASRKARGKHAPTTTAGGR